MLEAPAQSAKWKPHTSAESVLRSCRGQLLPRTPSTMAGPASILQLQDELLHRIWTELPRTEDAADAGPRLCCRRFRDIVFKHGSALRWQAGGALSSLDALPALLTKFTTSGGSSSSLTQLCLNDAPLLAAHCGSLVNAAGKGTLDLLRTFQLKCERSHPIVSQLMLGVVLGRCRHLTSLDLSRSATFAMETCSVCEKLLAVPPPSQPFAGLQALQLRRWLFSAGQLSMPHDALSRGLSRLVSLDLELWQCDADDQPLMVDVCGAALASGTLREFNICSLLPLRERNQPRASALLQSHHCKLIQLDVPFFLTSATSLSSVLAYNSHIQQLRFSCLWQLGEGRPSSDEIGELLQVLARLTSPTKLHLSVMAPHDPAPALRHLTRLTELGVRVEHGAAGPRFSNRDAMAEALQQLPHLRSLRIYALPFLDNSDSLLPAVIGRILQGCSQQLTSLDASAIMSNTDQPFQQLMELGAALRRLTNLQVLRLPILTTPGVGDLNGSAAAATVAAALPHMTALTELDMVHFASQGDLSRIGVLGVVSAASMLPSLHSITLPLWLQPGEQG